MATTSLDPAPPSRAAGKAVTGAALVAALGGLLFGYDTGVISAALLYIAPEFQLSELWQQVVVASLLVGAIVGVGLGGVIADALGRRRTLSITSVVFTAGAVISALAPDLPTLLGSRLLLGFAIGTASLSVPAYIAEIAPPEKRGSLVSINQIMISSGILLSYMSGYVLAEAGAWRWMLGLAGLPSLLMFAGLFRLPESPRWLVSRGRLPEAREVLRRIVGPDRVESELRTLSSAVTAEDGVTYRDVLKPAMRPAIYLGIGVAAVNQLVGVNAITYYAPTLLTKAGFGASAAILSSVGIGVANVAFTLVGLLLVDRIGRRPLLLVGLGGVVISLVGIGLLYAVTDLSGGWGVALVALLITYEAMFSASIGLAMWLINSEIFPTALRGKAGSFGMFTHWGLNLIISLTVLSAFEAFTPSGLFWLYALFGLIGFFYLKKYLPETRNRTLEEVEEILRARARK
ncbi:sugar porter family MFS transporter [Saccharopolyspora sp. NFXS83]|uniref:sugar porter family MFS transporter n=1 Tax=Saccharopolyspora sp. NFXS83 TaxID=2993560 RepID=UPI00224A74E8|nr:sugar porter family MFS transporter [Saccharopolyspora sp. NFXS83]MCX2729547.1 sugar porter family MFS transporter [Saccharopolyspora sp. NFXS83]